MQIRQSVRIENISSEGEFNQTRKIRWFYSNSKILWNAITWM